MIETLTILFADWRDTHDLGLMMLLGGGLVGIIFGVLAERIDFCSRTAFGQLFDGSWRQDAGPVLCLLVAMLAAIGSVQMLAASEAVDFTTTGETDLRVGGIALGSLIFGIGMALCRGCISRLLVLTGRGNLRALFTLGFLGLVAWSSISGVLAAPRMALAGWLTLSVDSGFSATAALLTGGLLLGMVAFILSRIKHIPRHLGAAAVIGLMVGLAFAITGMVGADDFDPVAVEGLLFTRPLTETLAYFTYGQTLSLKFGIGLVPGCVLGAAISAGLGGRSRIETFDQNSPHPLRYLAGAIMMGFGGVVSGGCTIGWMLTNAASGHLGLIIAVAGFLTGMKLATSSFGRRLQPT